MYPTKKLSEITSLITKGSTPTTYGYGFLSEGINFIKIENISNGTINKSYLNAFISEEAHLSQKRSILEDGDFLISIAGTIGSIALVSKDILPANTNQALAIVRGYENFVNKDFLRYIFLSSISNGFKNKARGGALQNISLEDIKNIEIPLPPLSTQSLIVAKLDEAFVNIDGQIGLLKMNIEDVENMKKSTLEESFFGKDLKMRKIGEICDFKNGFAFKSGEFNEEGTGLQVIRIGNVLNLDKNQVFILESEQFKEFELLKEDIIIGMTGTRKKRDYLLPGIILENNKYYLNQRVGRLRVFKDILDYKFLYFYLKTNIFRDKIFLYETGTVNQGNLSGKDISNQGIPLPPLPCQHEIVAHLDAVFDTTQKLRKEYEEQIRDLETMKQSLLEEAFAGRLVEEE